MKTLTPIQYQSLPVNEQSNWKEQKQRLVNNSWRNVELGCKSRMPVRTIYIPIIPESVLQDEMGSITKISDINPVHVEAMLKYPVPFTPERISFIKGAEFGHSQGKKDRNKEVIDIMEAEIKDCDYCASQCSDEIAVKICNAEKSALKVVLRKLKEIK